MKKIINGCGKRAGIFMAIICMAAMIGCGGGGGGGGSTPTPPTISGTPAASVVAGAAYSFVPTATGNNLTFSIVNKPVWASFNATTGALEGTPTAANVGTTSGIVISVTDGITTVSLPAFSVTVSPAPLSGSVVQGSVSGAIVFADHATGPEANFKMDASEASTATTTAADGTFTLAAVPSYDYISVSQGGVDSITGKPAMQMLAPAGVGVVSPLTTMVTMNPATESVIASLGVNYTDDISKSVTPAALLLVQSIQAVATTLKEAMDPAGNILTNDQSNAIQRTLLQAVANSVVGQTAAQLTNTAILSTTLTTALTNALNTVTADPVNSNISIPNTSTLANSVISPDFIGIVGSAISTTGTFSTTEKAAEATIITPADAAAINAETTKESELASENVDATPKPNTPPTISGTPAVNVLVGAAYSFTPTAADAEGNSLTFSIVNKPAWATFNQANGILSGTPTAANVGTTSGIIISVSDGVSSVALPAFNLTVSTEPYTPPTISGTPEDSIFVGETYSFTPTATGNNLTFSIANQPAWASFNTATGALSGTPIAVDVGTTAGIVISVTDGITTVSLPAFSLTVSAVTGGGGGGA